MFLNIIFTHIASPIPRSNEAMAVSSGRGAITTQIGSGASSAVQRGIILQFVLSERWEISRRTYLY